MFLKRGGGDLELRYSPDQPRVPAGSPDGGQWTGGGGFSGGGAGGARDDARRRDVEGQVQTALNANPGVANELDSLISRIQQRYSIDLSEEEAQGGHAISRHVSRSKEQLVRRADRNRIGVGNYGIWEDRVSSFTSLLAANNLVNKTLSQFEPLVEEVRSGKKGSAVLKAWFDQPTGYESYRRRFHDWVIIRDTSGVAIVIRRAPHLRKGFVIVTAYPVNP